MNATSPAHPPSQARPRRHVESWCMPADHSCPHHSQPPQSCRNQPRDPTTSLIHGFRLSCHGPTQAGCTAEARRDPPTQKASQFRQLRSDEVVAVRRASHRAPDASAAWRRLTQVDAAYVGVDAHLARADDRGDCAEHGEDESELPFLGRSGVRPRRAHPNRTGLRGQAGPADPPPAPLDHRLPPGHTPESSRREVPSGTPDRGDPQGDSGRSSYRPTRVTSIHVRKISTMRERRWLYDSAFGCGTVGSLRLAAPCSPW